MRIPEIKRQITKLDGRTARMNGLRLSGETREAWARFNAKIAAIEAKKPGLGYIHTLIVPAWMQEVEELVGLIERDNPVMASRKIQPTDDVITAREKYLAEMEAGRW